MMHTEEAARELWCPMARTSFNHADPAPLSCRCIASKCAMWRWAGGTRTIWKHTLEPVPPNVVYTKDSVIQEPITDRGFCGLAGRPS